MIIDNKLSWKDHISLQMSFLYIKVMILCRLTTIDLFRYCVFCQRSLKRLCTIGLQLSLKYLKFYMIINMDLGRSHSLIWHFLLFIDKVIEAIENGEYVIGVFLYLSKAFHTVDKILLDKLDHYGIRGCAFSWFKCYLSRRLQYVTYNGSQSSQQMLKCGVPQG